MSASAARRDVSESPSASGAGYYQTRTDTDRKTRIHIRQLQALGFDVTITKAV